MKMTCVEDPRGRNHTVFCNGKKVRYAWAVDEDAGKVWFGRQDTYDRKRDNLKLGVMFGRVEVKRNGTF